MVAFWLDRRTHRTIDWSAAIGAGVVASAAFLVLEMVLDFLFVGQTLGGRIRMIAAIALGEGVLPPPSSLDPEIVLAAIAVHFVLAIIYATVLAWLILRAGLGVAEVIGLLFGLILYLFNFFVMTRFFPWFAEERTWVSLVTHLTFGAVAALEYKALARRRVEAGEH